MAKTPFHDENFTFMVGGEPRRGSIRSPASLATHPALLIVPVCSEAESVFADVIVPTEGIGITPNVFLAAGHRVATYDMYAHGTRVDKKYGDSLQGIAAAIDGGFDVYADEARTGAALIDHCHAQGWAHPEGAGVFVQGTSRGGLVVLHVMAGDRRVAGGTIHVPVTHLPAVREFAHLAENPILQRSNAAALIPQLVGRPMLIAIGMIDPRVSSPHTFEFHAQFSAQAPSNQPQLFTGPGQSHGRTFPHEAGYQAAAGFLLRLVAERTKVLPVNYT